MHSTDPGTGTVYLLHLDTPYKHARHYTGWTTDLDARLQAHRNGHGARLMEVVKAAGITWRLVRTWPGGRDRERAIKDRHEAPRLCPACSAQPRPVCAGRSAPPVATAPPVVTEPPPQPPADPYECGKRNGEQFLAERAGWPAGKLIATFEYVTGPFREKARHTAAEQEWFRGYTEPITRHIAQAGTADLPPAPGSGSQDHEPDTGDNS